MEYLYNRFTHNTVLCVNRVKMKGRVNWYEKDRLFFNRGGIVNLYVGYTAVFSKRGKSGEMD